MNLAPPATFVQKWDQILYPNGGTLPNFPRFRVDEEEKWSYDYFSVWWDSLLSQRLEVYPNPSTGLFTIKLPEFIGDANLVVSNINGQIVHKKKLGIVSSSKWISQNVVAGHYNIEVYLEKNFDKVFYGRQVVKL